MEFLPDFLSSIPCLSEIQNKILRNFSVKKTQYFYKIMSKMWKLIYKKLIAGDWYFTMSQNRLNEMESVGFELKMAHKMHFE